MTMLPTRPHLIHATALSLGGVAVLVRGASGAGKSDLALRCLALAPGPLVSERFELIADDQVHMTLRDRVLIASCPPTIHGLIEVRGVGIIRVEPAVPAPVRLIVDLVAPGAVPRLPDDTGRVSISGIEIPHLVLDPTPASAPLKLALALIRAASMTANAAVQRVAN